MTDGPGSSSVPDDAVVLQDGEPPLLAREFLPGDLPAVMALHIRAMEEVGAYRGPGPWDDDLADIPGHYTRAHGRFLVVYAGEELVGMGAFRRVDGVTMEVKRMRVQSGMQGRGIGGRILNLLLQEGVRAGYRVAILETSEVQAAANRLYSAAGFVAMGKEMMDGRMCTWYRRELWGGEAGTI